MKPDNCHDCQQAQRIQSFHAVIGHTRDRGTACDRIRRLIGRNPLAGWHLSFVEQSRLHLRISDTASGGEFTGGLTAGLIHPFVTKKDTSVAFAGSGLSLTCEDMYSVTAWQLSGTLDDGSQINTPILAYAPYAAHDNADAGDVRARLMECVTDSVRPEGSSTSGSPGAATAIVRPARADGILRRCARPLTRGVSEEAVLVERRRFLDSDTSYIGNVLECTSVAGNQHAPSRSEDQGGAGATSRRAGLPWPSGAFLVGSVEKPHSQPPGLMVAR
jgi:hypothetical protein